MVASVIGDKPALASGDRRALTTGDRLLTDALAEGLVRFDAAGQIEAGLAERWIVTDGGMSYIFRLRDARWPDGSPVRAARVVALLKRQLGGNARNEVSPYLTAVSSIVEMTPEVIEIELARPRPDLLKLFAQPNLALVEAAGRGGAGPMRVKRSGAHSWLLTPAPDPARDPDEDGPTPEDDVRLIGERAARAIVRFVNRGSDLVSGGTIDDWPQVALANAAPSNIRVDPAAGLFGLAFLRRDGFLADAGTRAAIAAAFNRTQLTAAISSDFVTRETVLPEQLDSALPPAAPIWSSATADQRLAAIRSRTAAWRRANGAPVLRIALPEGPGGAVLWGRLGADLYAMGIRPERVPLSDASADLRLIDRVAPYDSARWYLAEACVACAPEVTQALDEARLAPTLAARGAAIARADAALAADAAFVPLARPFRWSLVSLRLAQWQPNARAWHPLNRLRADTK